MFPSAGCFRHMQTPQPFYPLRRVRVAASLLALCVFVLAAGNAARAAEVRLEPTLGNLFHPGAWLPVTARVEGVYGTFRPCLELREEAGGAPRYTCRLPEQTFHGSARLSFPALTGNVPLLASVSLEPTAEAAKESVHVSQTPLRLLPLAPPTRMQVWVGGTTGSGATEAAGRMQQGTRAEDLPQEAWLYENVDLLVLGQADRPPHLTPRQCEAIGEWVAGGGIVIALHQSTLELLVQNLPAGQQAGPLQPFPLAQPPYPQERRCGLGRMLLLDAARSGSDPAYRLAQIGLQLTRALREQNVFLSRQSNPRLAPALYRASGDWPSAPALAWYIPPALAGGWLLVSVIVLLLLKRRYAYPLMALPGVLLLALPVLPVPDGTKTVRHLLLPAQSQQQQTQLRTLLLLPPFPGRTPAGVNALPPRPLSRTNAEIDQMHMSLEQIDAGWSFRVEGTHAGELQILSTRQTLPPDAFATLLSGLSGAPGVLVQGADAQTLPSAQVAWQDGRLQMRPLPASAAQARPAPPASVSPPDRDDWQAVQRLLIAPQPMLPQENALLLLARPPYYYGLAGTAEQFAPIIP